tara:strand:- start:113612 stop:113986 length:375 start_codon:yes stop_codon:yes gene_type:complete
MKFLIVDDSNAIALMVSEMLKEMGYTSDRAVDGNDAVKKLEADNSFDFILLDWNMPNMSGIEFLKYNYENHLTETPIIMMTTENKPENIREALMFGASEYIMKPFTKDIIESKISMLNQFKKVA